MIMARIALTDMPLIKTNKNTTAALIAGLMKKRSPNLLFSRPNNVIPKIEM